MIFGYALARTPSTRRATLLITRRAPPPGRYSLAFTPGSAFIGGAKRFWLNGLGPDDIHPNAPTIPEVLFMAYQGTFAIITSALITGAPAERMKYSSLLVFSALWSILVYSPVAHWCWHPEGFLLKAGVLEFAGGNVVHVNSVRSKWEGVS